MNSVFAFDYLIGLLLVFGIFGVAGVYGSNLILSTLKLCRYYSRTLGAVAGAIVGYALLGMIPLFH